MARFGSGIALITGLTMLMLFSILSPDIKNVAKEKYLNEAHTILSADSVHDNTNMKKAIFLLLKIQSEYVSENEKSSDTINFSVVRYEIILGLLLLACIVIPKPVIGIGKAKSLLNRYRLYTKFVIVTIPSLFILPFLVDWIKNNLF